MDEHGRDLLLVRLELRECLPDVSIFVRRIFQLDDTEWQAVNENHHVRAAVVLALDHRELVDHEPVVGVGVLKINQANDFRADAAVLATALDGDAVHENPVEGAVLGDEVRAGGDGDFAVSVIERLRRQLGIQLPQRSAQPIRQERLAKTDAFRRRLPRSDVLAMQQRIIQFTEP